MTALPRPGLDLSVNVAGINFKNPILAASGSFGYGVEFALTRNWSAKAETDYISFGDSSVSASDGSALNVGMHLWETTIGLNYRFNPGPVIANR